jgi:formylglycine-generating enzyme required for sulfatase activity
MITNYPQGILVMKHFRKFFLLTLGLTLVSTLSLSVWQITDAQTRPLTYPEINTALNSKLPNKSFKNKTELINWLIVQIKKRRIDKPLTEDREDDLRQAGATNQLIEMIRTNSPSLTNPMPSRTPISSNDSKTFKNSIGMEFIKIPNGSFMMGSENGESDEKPVHRVTISNGFWMGKTEVTQGQWKAVMGNNPSSFNNCGDNCPVENVSWEDVQNYLRKLNARDEGKYRLPTEAEWEYACRAGSTTRYSYGDGESYLGNYAWYSANSGGKSHEVATKQPNDWGLYDMHGNVWEWTQDWYGSYQSGSVNDPTGVASSSLRVLRGGSWYVVAGSLRCADRISDSPSFQYSVLGFRLVKN